MLCERLVVNDKLTAKLWVRDKRMEGDASGSKDTVPILFFDWVCSVVELGTMDSVWRSLGELTFSTVEVISGEEVAAI